MCAPGAPSARPRRARAGSHPHPQVVDPADSFRPADAHGRRFVQARGLCSARIPVAFGEPHGSARPLYSPARARGEAGWQPAQKRFGATISAISCRMGPVPGSFVSWTPFRRLFCFARRPLCRVFQPVRSRGRRVAVGEAIPAMPPRICASIRFHTRSRRPCATWAGWKRSAARPPSAAGTSAKSGPATPRPSGDRRDLARRAERSPASGPRQEPEGLPPRRLSAAPPARPEILRRTPPRARRRPDAARLRDRSGARPVTALGDYPSLPRRAIQPHWMPPVLEGAACRQ